MLVERIEFDDGEILEYLGFGLENKNYTGTGLELAEQSIPRRMFRARSKAAQTSRS